MYLCCKSAILVGKIRLVQTHTKEFFRLIMLMISTSILSERPIIHMLNRTSRLYFTTPTVSLKTLARSAGAFERRLEENKTISLTSLIHKLMLDSANKIPIQRRVNNKINAFFASIPYIVDAAVFSRDLEPCRNPDAIHGDIDSCDENSNPNPKSHSFLAVNEENRDPVDDDLQ
jgi:hypothetical protein